MTDILPESFSDDSVRCIEDIRKYLSSERDITRQRTSDFKVGLFRKKSGILVPWSEYEHRIQFENHELFVLDGYLILIRNLLSDLDTPLSYFSLRTVYDIGMNKLGILFSKNINKNDVNSFKLIDTMSDMVGMTDEKYLSFFIKLLEEESRCLDKDMLCAFEQARDSYKNNKVIPIYIIRKIRTLLNKRVKQWSKDIRYPEILKDKTNFDALNVYWSHLLHGNTFMIRVALLPEFAPRNKNHIHALLWHTNLSIIFNTISHIEDPQIKNHMDDLINKAPLVWKEIVKRGLEIRQVFKK